MFKERTTLSVDSKIQSGKYLPSSVWESKGWDKNLIEEKVEDFVLHPILGCKCYNVETLAKRSEETQQEKMSTAMRASVTVPKGGGARAPQKKAGGLPKSLEDWEPEHHAKWIANAATEIEQVQGWMKCEGVPEMALTTVGHNTFLDGVKLVQQELMGETQVSEALRVKVVAIKPKAKAILKKIAKFQALRVIWLWGIIRAGVRVTRASGYIGLDYEQNSLDSARQRLAKARQPLATVTTSEPYDPCHICETMSRRIYT